MLTSSTDRKNKQETKQDWRRRARSHYQNISDLLRERAEQGLGVKGSELYAHPDLYGRSPRNRISELKKDGWSIGSKPAGGADWFYFLRSDNSDHVYPTSRFEEPSSSPRPRLVAQPPPKSWEEWDKERSQPKQEQEWSLVP
jgi:hypothetical protein